MPFIPDVQILTSGYDGLIRMLDVNKEMFSMVYSSYDAIFSLSHRPNDVKSLYFGDGQGQVKVCDERARKISSSYILHARRINSINFSSMNNNLMATSSTDGTACIWDLRNINPCHPKSMKMVNHQRAVHSAYFSPSGNCLATTRSMPIIFYFFIFCVFLFKLPGMNVFFHFSILRFIRYHH